MYVQGRGVRRVVFWNDVNGVPFLLTKVGESSMEDHDIVVEDCTVGASTLFYLVFFQLDYFPIRLFILGGCYHPALADRCLLNHILCWIHLQCNAAVRSYNRRST